MAKKEDRVVIDMACTECRERTYTTEKNRRNDPDRIELKKFCPRCREILAVEKFDKNAGRRDGRQVYCRECWPLYMKYWNKRPEAGFLASQGEMRRRKSPEGTKKFRARQLTWHAIKFGYLVPPATCEHPGCAAPKPTPHHTQYDKPLDGLRWLCKVHHLEAHGGRWDRNGEA